MLNRREAIAAGAAAIAGATMGKPVDGGRLSVQGRKAHNETVVFIPLKPNRIIVIYDGGRWVCRSVDYDITIQEV